MIDEKNTSQHLRLFSSAPQPCSYIDQQDSSSIFIDPDAEISPQAYSQLSQLGFRRSGNFIYKPDCTNCQACIPMRIPVSQFKASKSQKRILKKNADLNIFETHSIQSDKYYQLYSDYINLRHADGDMYPASREQYDSFLNNPFGCTKYFSFSDKDKVIAVSVVDQLIDGLSAVYTFYDPNEESRSLGTLAILWQIQHAAQQNLQHLYLGYWIKNCQKMNYKSRFKPSEILINQKWTPLR